MDFPFYMQYNIDADNLKEAKDKMQSHLDAGNLMGESVNDWLLDTDGNEMPTPTIDLSKIDWPLLRTQKAFCLGALQEEDLHKVERDMFQGIVHCFDSIQDSAAIALGEEAVFGKLKTTEVNPLVNPLNHCLTLLMDMHNNYPQKELHRPIEEVIEEAKEAIEPFVNG